MSGLLEDRAYCAGEWYRGSRSFPVYDPSDGALLAEVCDVETELLSKILATPGQTLQWWNDLGPWERGSILGKWAQLIDARANELAELITREQGKPLREAQGEVARAASYIRWYIGESQRMHARELEQGLRGGRAVVRWEPVGKVLAITPWNFPLLGPVVKCAGALAAGCAVILKPSEETPLSALAMARLAEEAELPPGLLQVVTTSRPKEISEILLADTRIRMLSFTGSEGVGKHLLDQVGMRKIVLELGGNAPLVVCADARVEQAARDAIAAKFYNNGQICLGINRIFLHKDIYDRFKKIFVDKMLELRLGSGLDPRTTVGPLINGKAMAKMKRLVSDAVSRGARVVVGGGPSKAGKLFFQPTLLENLDGTMDIFHEEIFGPIACLYKVDSLDEALDLATWTDFGLGAYFYTQEKKLQEKCARLRSFGMIGINTCHLALGPHIPFGGVGSSGIGREGGEGCLREYCEQRLYVYGDG